MLVPMIMNIYAHPMFWWAIVPLIGVTLLVAFMLWESRFPNDMRHHHH